MIIMVQTRNSYLPEGNTEDARNVSIKMSKDHNI